MWHVSLRVEKTLTSDPDSQSTELHTEGFQAVYLAITNCQSSLKSILYIESHDSKHLSSNLKNVFSFFHSDGEAGSQIFLH